jgi:uncharacterized membrane protein YphA (DoxX/SURF4 family)
MEHRRGPDPLGILVFLFRLILGCMFVYAGVMKILDPAGFAQAIVNYRILPLWMVNGAAILLPWVEVLAGLSLVMGLLLPGGSFLIAGLLLVFACSLGFDLWRGLDISCGCFGSGRDAITWLTFLRDALLFGAACLVWVFCRRGPLALDDLVPRR